MKLNLKRPLAFFDLETTGVNVASDRIVEISILKAMPDGTEDVKTLRINPGIPIPLESSLIHGIYDEDIRHERTFKQSGEELARFLDDCDLAGYNSNRFDIPVLMEEFLRAGIDFDIENRHFVDVQNIFHQMEQRTLKAAYQFYCGKDIENAHSAEADIKATYEVLKAQIERYENQSWEDKKGVVSKPVQNNIEALHAFTNLNKPVDFAARMVYNEDGVEVINFGKHKGRPVEDVFQSEPSYYNWMMNGDFPLYTKRCLEKIWNRFNAKKEQLRTERQTAVAAPKPEQSTLQKPKEEAKPITNDHLEQLKMKFGK
ncbi:MAG: DNA polymerase III subunit epsilon [Sphingobacteriales bacterium 17-39-43]|uniref:3'-5' exonuclease n=1 Tax=Daejeonella sp. TaxID=2805397 RepID=UPI000BDAF2F7|nr:3'-5' exonuclease [Daejeonella sp.]OYY02204.1 MAG: DNA polymerase III subunit epsilon [Sphingobacteriia bacterium 35-40-5]OYZ33097.1 MAG: DNA polymerase III subunit epsilon [Sphingobacteriales bacterium 16-39-50]OYZ52668.1 MAG: DNA polymerase III subunit epsilon [Sphingobacteriales bacterium 24-40-4]OZA26506.1 MAG: DNA polymerase III subunit epsilon [Sphingobacteriales bacterium 17-39-43]OZA60601.1 MAG: DNA polymerase III subunit epsilon [Sphingobacteriales bacterium 39-40-5]